MRIDPVLKLVCSECGWRPLGTDQMQIAKNHFDEHHDGRTVKLDLSAICVCGKEMRFSHTTMERRLFHDHFVCDCGNVGFVQRSGNA